ncbi:unnamed protein product [Brassica oleracea var. botrytis]
MHERDMVVFGLCWPWFCRRVRLAQGNCMLHRPYNFLGEGSNGVFNQMVLIFH